MGNFTDYTYDSGNDEPRSRANLKTMVEYPGPRGVNPEGGLPANGEEIGRTTAIAYDNYFNQPTAITYANGLQVTHSLDEQGNVIRTQSINIPGLENNFKMNGDGALLYYFV